MTSSSRISAGQLEKKGSVGGLAVSHAAILAFLAGVACLCFLGASFFGTVKSVVQPAVLTGFAVNICLGLVAYIISLAKAPISFSQIHWVFYLTFFCLAPLSQYLNAYSCWDYVLSDNDYINTNFIILIWGACVFTFSSLRGKGGKVMAETINDPIDCIPHIRVSRMLVMLGLGVVATFLVVAVYGFENLFSRSTMESDLPLTLDLIFGKVIRPLPIFVLAFGIIFFRQQNKKTLFSVLVLILCIALSLLADFPAAMARYNAACFYGGLAIIAIPSLRKKKGLFSLFFLVLFLVVFPATNMFKTSVFDMNLFLETIGSIMTNLSTGFCAVDYDAYSLIARTVHYVDVYGLTWGKQLLTSLLFFVPRAVWAAKSVGTGELVSSAQGQRFTDLSSPLAAEGYVDFGMVGVVCYAAILGLLIRRFDGNAPTQSLLFSLFRPFGVLMFFFVMRGSLLSTWAYTVGFFISFSFVALVAFGGIRKSSRADCHLDERN